MLLILFAISNFELKYKYVISNCILTLFYTPVNRQITLMMKNCTYWNSKQTFLKIIIKSSANAKQIIKITFL